MTQAKIFGVIFKQKSCSKLVGVPRTASLFNHLQVRIFSIGQLFELHFIGMLCPPVRCLISYFIRSSVIQMSHALLGAISRKI